MAKKVKSTGNHNRDLLSAIGSATASNSFMYITQNEGMPLLDYNPPLIEVNTKMLDPNDQSKAAARITQAGVDFLKGNVVETKTVEVASNFEIMSNVPLPASKRGNFGKGGGAPNKYPFDKLEIGNTFFVAATAKHPDPVKTMGSAVSAATMRFAKPTGEMKTVTRTKRGADHKALVVDGVKQTETKSVPVYAFERKFTIRSVKASDKLGDWTAPSDGALIGRVVVG